MRPLWLSLAVALCALPRGAQAEEPRSAELPAPATESDDGEAWLEADEPREQQPSDELPEPGAPPPVEEPAADEERPRRREKRTVPTNEYGLPVPSEGAVRVRLVPELEGTSVRIISRADGIKKHDGVRCDAPCTLTLAPGDYGVEVWQDGRKASGRRVRILKSQEIKVAPANRQLALSALGVGIAGVVAAVVGYTMAPLLPGAHGEVSGGGNDTGTGLGLMLGGIAVASVGFPVFFTNMPASVDRKAVEVASATTSDASRSATGAAGTERVTGLNGGFHF